MLKIESEDGSSRTGKLRLNHAVVKTPFFMPVATKAVGKFVDAKDLASAGAECIISNSLILDMMVGSSRIKALGGLHKFMGWDRGIFTDSGGFQMYSEHLFVSTKKNGIEFKNPVDGKKKFCTPENSMEIQDAIGSDVAMCLDDMPPYGSEKERIAESISRTYEWAVQCKARHDELNSRQLLFGICQGGTFHDLREKSAKLMSEIDFDGFAFGGLALGEPMDRMFSAVSAGIRFMPNEKPRYLMGVGVPSQIVEAVSMGVDCFDSTYPTMTARHNWLLTQKGTIDIFKKQFENDQNPIDEDCDCPACKSLTRAYMHHVARTKEPAGFRLRTIHNIRFMTRMMDEIRTAIKESSLSDLKKKYSPKQEPKLQEQ